ncbi:hypothetical protein CDD83_4530 [Cordyceps sp. RAO-2017]|nr:hypothetical protein CDD83_4530 [Cordyceps sp. RAO-2017]
MPRRSSSRLGPAAVADAERAVVGLEQRPAYFGLLLYTQRPRKAVLPETKRGMRARGPARSPRPAGEAGRSAEGGDEAACTNGTPHRDRRGEDASVRDGSAPPRRGCGSGARPPACHVGGGVAAVRPRPLRATNDLMLSTSRDVRGAE